MTYTALDWLEYFRYFFPSKVPASWDIGVPAGTDVEVESKLDMLNYRTYENSQYDFFDNLALNVIGDDKVFTELVTEALQDSCYDSSFDFVTPESIDPEEFGHVLTETIKATMMFNWYHNDFASDINAKKEITILKYRQDPDTVYYEDYEHGRHTGELFQLFDVYPIYE